MREAGVASPPPASPSGRVDSVDLLRGLTMAAMIVVNNPGSWVHMLTSLAHAQWGAVPAPADFVFPFFLFLVGVSTPLALERRLRNGTSEIAILRTAARRAALLFAIGLFLNLFPQFDLATLRIPGVLQRIAVVYFGCVVAGVAFSSISVLAIVVGLLSVYSSILVLVPVPGIGVPMLTPEINLAVWLDDVVFGVHTWRGPGDPEGILSTLGALSTGLIGLLAGRALAGREPTRAQSARIAAGGVVALVVGLIAALFLPVAKEVWTASYALVTAGAALLALAWVHRDMEGGPDVPSSDRGSDAKVMLLLGRQALLAYVVAHLLSDLSIHVVRVPAGAERTLSLHSFVYERLLASWMPMSVASLAYALLFLAVVVLVVVGLDRRGVRLKV